MTIARASVLDPDILPAALETVDRDILLPLYQTFIALTEENWQQLATAIEKHDLNKVKSIAHKLKSSSASIGAMQLADSLRIIETLAAAEQYDPLVVLLPETSRTVDDTIQTTQRLIERLMSG